MSKYQKCANFLCSNRLPQYKENRNKVGYEMYCCRRCENTCPPLMLKIFKEHKLNVESFMISVEQHKEDRSLKLYCKELGIDIRTLISWYNKLRDF